MLTIVPVRRGWRSAAGRGSERFVERAGAHGRLSSRPMHLDAQTDQLSESYSTCTRYRAEVDMICEVEVHDDSALNRKVMYIRTNSSFHCDLLAYGFAREVKEKHMKSLIRRSLVTSA